MLQVRPKNTADAAWADAFMIERWAGTLVHSGGRIHDTRQLPGLVAEVDGVAAGLLHYVFRPEVFRAEVFRAEVFRPEVFGAEIRAEVCEVVTLDARQRVGGVGSALIEAVVSAATAHGCRELVVTTTNDNLDALRFYQRRGFALAALRPRALDAVRAAKPGLPETGAHGIPLRDELDLVRTLAPPA